MAHRSRWNDYHNDDTYFARPPIFFYRLNAFLKLKNIILRRGVPRYKPCSMNPAPLALSRRVFFLSFRSSFPFFRFVFSLVSRFPDEGSFLFFFLSLSLFLPFFLFLHPSWLLLSVTFQTRKKKKAEIQRDTRSKRKQPERNFQGARDVNSQTVLSSSHTHAS